MKNMNHFLNKLYEETDTLGQEETSKNLAKEEALRLIADFVKTVKGKFTKAADRSEILKAAEKTLQFYIDEIENDSFSSSLAIDYTPPEPQEIPDDMENDFDEGEEEDF